MNLYEINTLPVQDVVTFLADTLFNRTLAEAIVRSRPFKTVDQLCQRATEAWHALSPDEKRASFDAHPRIGDVAAARNRPHSQTEQSGVYSAAQTTIEALATLNRQYEEKFGFRFLVFASGKTGDELLAALTERLNNEPNDELRIAGEQKIRINDTRLRKIVKGGSPVSVISSWKPVVSLYVLSIGCLILGPWTGQVWPLIVALVVFTLWDGFWLLTNDDDRNAQEMLDTSTRARTYMSYYIAIYGAAIAFILPLSDSTQRAAALALLTASAVPGWLLIAPLVLCSVAMMFFPIKLGIGAGTPLEQRKPTDANVAIVIFNAWTQKAATFIFVYAVLMIVAPVWRSDVSTTHPPPNAATTTSAPGASVAGQ